jgi:NAD(P)-dependent dehydrogenase (short-subunit alcohol dehydrogenase family)
VRHGRHRGHAHVRAVRLHLRRGRPVAADQASPGNTYFAGGFWQGIEDGDPGLSADSLASNPTGRMGTAEEMARAVVFLSSPVSSFTTGTNLVVDGALTRGIQL